VKKCALFLFDHFIAIHAKRFKQDPELSLTSEPAFWRISCTFWSQKCVTPTDGHCLHIGALRGVATFVVDKLPWVKAAAKRINQLRTGPAASHPSDATRAAS
jgi:hypothetical protein